MQVLNHCEDMPLIDICQQQGADSLGSGYERNPNSPTFDNHLVSRSHRLSLAVDGDCRDWATTRLLHGQLPGALCAGDSFSEPILYEEILDDYSTKGLFENKRSPAPFCC